MTVKKLTRKALDQWIDELIRFTQVVGVQAKGEQRFDFAPLASAKDLRLDYDVTIQPPKKYFLPPCETLMTYRIGGGYTSVYEEGSLVLVGVHPYDVVAISQLDTLFGQDNQDDHYLRRRQGITIIACDVVTPSKNVFASSMNTAVVKDGFDILLTEVGDGMVAQAATAKGEALLGKAKGAPEASKADLGQRQQVWDRNAKGLSRHQLKCDPHYLPKLLDKAYDHPVWKERAKTCFSCGSCNQVCPTCYCFDMRDDVDWAMAGGTRQRAWDGCLLDGFTKVAGNHEFRKERADRFRHRLYRKAKYVPAKIGGQIACVGCGRCVNACLPNIANPVEVYNTLLDDIGIS